MRPLANKYKYHLSLMEKKKGIRIDDNLPTHKRFPEPLTVLEIGLTVSDFFNLPLELILDSKQREFQMRCRQLIAHFCIIYCIASYQDIADFIGYVTHSNVLHGHNKIKDLCYSDPIIKEWEYRINKLILKKYYNR